MGIAPRDLIVALHVGGSHSTKRWPVERFAEVADSLAEAYGARIVVLVDPEGHGATLPLRTPACYLTPSLRELMGFIGSCDLLICNQGGPMHIADALGVPVAAVFTSGNPRWYGLPADIRRSWEGAPNRARWRTFGSAMCSLRPENSWSGQSRHARKSTGSRRSNLAQTWRVTPAKRFVLGILGGVGAAAAPLLKILWPPRRQNDESVRRILVIELWLLGDVVLMTPMLRALRERFPGAEITVLAKPHAEELLRESGLADKIITFDFPWTAKADKYKPSRYDRRLVRDLIRRLRGENFDLAIDGRMDARSSALAYATGAPTRIGYDFGGGGFLLTHALRASPDDHHRAHDWLKLLRASRRRALERRGADDRGRAWEALRAAADGQSCGTRRC